MNSGDPETVKLALVTCGPQLEVALSVPSAGPPSSIRLAAGKPRSTLVLAAVDLLVENAGLTAANLDEIVVSRGPGSFTGIRAGLATVAGLAAATGARCLAYGSLLMLAARCDGPSTIWSAQPGRRGEVYACKFDIDRGGFPMVDGEIEILAVSDLSSRGPWSASEGLDLGSGKRVVAPRNGAEALIHLARLGAPPETMEPLYVEGPPIHLSAPRD